MSDTRSFEKDEQFWAQYMRGRPTVPDSFFHKILLYHTDHGGQFDTLHDAGAGAGVHTDRLASKFRHIIVSDPGASSIDQARRRLCNVPNCEFKVAKFEDETEISPQSVDVIVGFNMIHFVDPDDAIKAVDHQLKPGGTLALATFAYLVLDDSDAQKIWEEIFIRAGEDLMIRRGELDKTPPPLVRTILGTDLDAIPCPETVLKPGARRLRINYPEGYSYANMLVPPQYRERYLSGRSRIGPSDKVEYEIDDDWKMDLSIERLHELFRSHPLREETEGVTELWQQLRAIFGDGTMSGRWAVNLVLATKK